MFVLTVSESLVLSVSNMQNYTPEMCYSGTLTGLRLRRSVTILEFMHGTEMMQVKQ